MILIALLAVVYSSSVFLDLPAKLTEHSVVLHHFCLRMLPTTLESRSSLEALVCGKNMQEHELQHLLAQSSLIHIFIVSGSHFLLLHKVFARVPIVRFFTLWILSVYCLATLCQPPALRSLLFLYLAKFSEQRKFCTSPVVLIFLSCALSVCIFPQWLWSRSLLMSLLAALTIATMTELWGKLRETLPAMVLTQSAVYLVMAVCLWGFSTLHPLSILLNVLLAPLIGGVLFPLAFLVVLIPPLAFLFDGAMTALIWILQSCSELLAGEGSGVTVPVMWLWVFFIVLVFLTYRYLVFRNRRRARDAA